MEFILGTLFVLLSTVLVILVIVHINKTNTLARRLDLLESDMRKVHRIEEEITELQGRFPLSRKDAEPRVQATIPRPEPSFIPGSAIVPPAVEQPAVNERAKDISWAPGRITSFAAPTPSRTREEWEALIGGKLLNRVGALALVIGIGFFLKYAFDNNWINETMRVMIGGVIGAGLLLSAARAHKKKFEVFAQGLVGAGIAILYLSVFASFNFYHLVPQVPAFCIMSAVTVLAFLQAFRYDSLAVSLLGLLGGFLTPFLLSTGEANEIGLLTYIALLDAGLLAVVLLKDRWAVLEPLALGGTYLVYVLWYKEYYTADAMIPTTYFLFVFWVLFFGLEMLRNFRSEVSFAELRSATAIANVFLLYASLYSLIEPDHHNITGSVTLGLGVIYFVTAMIVRRASSNPEATFMRQTLTAIVLLVLATAIEFTGFTTVQWWSVEGLALAYCAVRWNLRFVWVSAAVVFGCALLKLLFIPETFSLEPDVNVGVLLNQRAATLALYSLSVGVGAFVLRRQPDRHRRIVSSTLDYIWPVVVFTLVTVETLGYFELLMMHASGDLKESLIFKEFMTLPVVWMIYSLLLTWCGMRWEVTPWKHAGLGSAILSICLAAIRGVTYVPVQDFILITNFRFTAMLCILLGTFVHAAWLRRREYVGAWSPDIASATGVLVIILIFEVITGETKDIFEKAMYLSEQHVLGEQSSEGSRLANLQQLSLSGVWLLYSIIMMCVGIWRRKRGIRVASFVLFGFTILKIFIYDLSFLDTLYRIFSFIGLGVILLAVSYLYQRYKDIIFGQTQDVAAEENSPGG